MRCPCRLLPLISLVLCLLPLPCLAGADRSLGPEHAPARPAGPAVPKVAGALASLAAGELRASQAGPAGLMLSQGRVLALARTLGPEHAPAVAAAARRLGGEEAARWGAWLNLWLPPSAVAELAGHPAVLYLAPPARVRPLSGPDGAEASAGGGPYISEGVAATGADLWHAAGYAGQGVRVAVLDFFQGWEQALAQGELPAGLEIREPLSLSSRHGVACAEVVHDMAPGARLTLASYQPPTPVGMARTIHDLARSGQRVITSSVGSVFYSPGYGTGPVSQAVSRAREEFGALVCQAMGNQAQFHWDGPFRDADRDGWHEFAAGVEVNALAGGRRLPGGVEVHAFLRWNDWPMTDQDYELCLVHLGVGDRQTVACSGGRQTGTQPPLEALNLLLPWNGSWGLAVRRQSGSGEHILDLNGYNLPPLAHNQPARSLVDPATGPDTVSVAAADVASGAWQPYSSRGPTHGPGGWRIGGRDKPELAGPDRVSTWTYGPQGFYGTSAATPHVAGAAALVWGAHPGWSAQEVLDYLLSRTTGPPYNHALGFGRLHLGAAP
jgi:hypothetical protein